MEKEKKFASGFSFYKFFWIFLFSCIFGAYYEEFLNLFVHYKYHHEWAWQLRRGVLYGPISPIYGFGAILIIFILGRKKRSDYKTLFYGAILGGGFEYLVSFFQELFLGTVSWDYTGDFLNINGRTTIPYAFVWGLLALTLIKVFYPAISNIVEALPMKFGKILTNILIVLVVLDFTISWGSLIRQSLRHNGVPSYTVVGKFFDKYYNDERLKESYNNMVVIEVNK